MAQAGRGIASVERANAHIDLVTRPLLAPTRPTLAWQTIPGHIDLEGNDYLQFYVTLTRDPGSAISLIHMHLAKSPGDGIYYHDLALVESDEGGYIRATAKPLYYGVVATAPGISRHLFSIPINEVAVQVAFASDVASDPADLVQIDYRRMIRDAFVPRSTP